MKKLSEIWKRANEIEKELWINLDAVLNKLTQELGEFNDVVQKYKWIYCRSRVDIEEVKKETWDLVFNLVSILNKIGISPDDIPDFAEQTLKNFERRKDTYRKFIE